MKKPPKIYPVVLKNPHLGVGVVAPPSIRSATITGGVGSGNFDKFKEWLHIDGGNPYSLYGTRPLEGGTP